MSLIIGLTGGIASGKSTVTDYLSKLNIPIIDADLIARQVVAPESKGLKLLIEAFGSGIIINGGLNRKKLREIVFNDKSSLSQLNAITHPLIREKIVNAIDYYRKSNKLAVLDAALLLENGLEVLVDEVWVVSLELNTQVQRLMLRDQIDSEAAKKIIERQMPLSEKVKKADLVLDNNHLKEDLLLQVKKCIEVRKSSC